jgi:hypothetical protein
MITPDEITKWQHLLDNIQNMPEEENKEELESLERRTEQHQQYASLSHPLEIFTCFGDLPLEIRLLIWRFARPDPRVVRLAWSKLPPKAPKNCSNPEIFRRNYSDAPIPAMLHACSESRQVALGWYRLALRHGKAKARVYFDFSADYLHVGCRDCDRWECERDFMGALNDADRRRIRRVVISCPGLGDPFLTLYWRFRFVKEILLYDPTTSPLITNTELSHLKQTTQQFDWQTEKDLYTHLIEQKARWKMFGEQEQNKGRENYYKEAHLFKPKKLARVELAVTPRNKQKIRFRITEKQFKGNDILTLNSIANANSNPLHDRIRQVFRQDSASSGQSTSVTISRSQEENFLRLLLLEGQRTEKRLGTCKQRVSGAASASSRQRTSVTIFRNLDKNFLLSLLDARETKQYWEARLRFQATQPQAILQQHGAFNFSVFTPHQPEQQNGV